MFRVAGCWVLGTGCWVLDAEYPENKQIFDLHL